MSKKLNDYLNSIEKRLAPFKKAEEKSRSLIPSLPVADLYIGLTGPRSITTDFEFIDDFCRIRPVVNPPGIVSISSAADHSFSDYLAVGRFSHNIKNELVMDTTKYSEDDNFMLDLAWNLVSLLKIIGPQSLQATTCSSKSWDSICAINDNSVKFTMLDDVSSKILLDNELSLDNSSFSWVKKHLLTALELRDKKTGKRFDLAFRAAANWNHVKVIRNAIVNLWIGLDALFGSKHDRPVTRTLVKRIAEWLDYDDDHKIFELYNLRCDALHGRPLAEEDLLHSTKSTHQLLKRSLIRALELGRQPIEDEK